MIMFIIPTQTPVLQTNKVGIVNTRNEWMNGMSSRWSSVDLPLPYAMKRLQLVLSNICIYWKAIKCCLWMYFQAWFFQVLSEYTALAFASSCGLKWTASVKKAKENEFESYFRCQGVRGTGFPLVRKGPRQRPPALDRWPLHNAAIHTIRAIQSF